MKHTISRIVQNEITHHRGEIDDTAGCAKESGWDPSRSFEETSEFIYFTNFNSGLTHSPLKYASVGSYMRKVKFQPSNVSM
jgi:hypothetical protein